MRNFVCIADTPKALVGRQLFHDARFLVPFVDHHRILKHQPSRRQRAKDLAAAQKLKAASQYIPLYKVDSTLWIETIDDGTHYTCVIPVASVGYSFLGQNRFGSGEVMGRYAVKGGL